MRTRIRMRINHVEPGFDMRTRTRKSRMRMKG